MTTTETKATAATTAKPDSFTFFEAVDPDGKILYRSFRREGCEGYCRGYNGLDDEEEPATIRERTAVVIDDTAEDEPREAGE